MTGWAGGRVSGRDGCQLLPVAFEGFMLTQHAFAGAATASAQPQLQHGARRALPGVVSCRAPAC